MGASCDRTEEGDFTAKTIPLGAYAGSTIEIRFLYAFDFGSYYSGSNVGWFVDNIEITEDQAQGVGYVEVDRRDVSGGVDSLFTPGEEGDFRFQVVHRHGGGTYPGRLFDLDVDTAADDTLQSMMTYVPMPSGELCLDFTAVNFIPYAVDLTYGGSVVGPYHVDGAHAPVEQSPGVFRSVIPSGAVPGLRFYRFDAEP